MSILDNARAMRRVIEQGAAVLDDRTVSTAPEALPRLRQDGSLIKAGERINWGGTIKRAAADLWDTAENTPDAAPDLWADLSYRTGYRIIPAVITVTTAFSADEYGWWGDTLYRSKVNSNVYTPAVYPDNWEKIK